MIDMMKQNVKPREFTATQYDLLPKGAYEVRIATIGEWKPKTQDSLVVYKFDDSGRKVQDANGKDLSTIERGVTTYSSQVIFEVISGAYSGAKVYHYLNLHPNQPWALPAFLSACRITDEVNPNDIKKLCEGVVVTALIDTETRPFKTTDKVTGIVSEELKERNVVKRIKALDLAV